MKEPFRVARELLFEKVKDMSEYDREGRKAHFFQLGKALFNRAKLIVVRPSFPCQFFYLYTLFTLLRFFLSRSGKVKRAKRRLSKQ